MNLPIETTTEVVPVSGEKVVPLVFQSDGLESVLGRPKARVADHSFDTHTFDNNMFALRWSSPVFSLYPRLFVCYAVTVLLWFSRFVLFCFALDFFIVE